MRDEMTIRYIIGFFIGTILTYSIFFGLEIASLYEDDIKRFFKNKKKK